MSKGSRNRTADKPRFDREFERIFRKKRRRLPWPKGFKMSKPSAAQLAFEKALAEDPGAQP